MIYLTESDVKELLNPEELLWAIRQSLVDLSAGKVIQPLRLVMPFHTQDATKNHQASAENGLLFLKPAQVGQALVTKLITFVPNNAAKGLPTLIATLILMDPQTGSPLAVIEGSYLTAMRTAAASAVAADALAPKNARVVALIGSGVLARSHAEMFRIVRPIEEIRIWSRSRENVARCAREIQGLEFKTAESAVQGADIICTVTNSSTPVVHGNWIKKGAFIAAVGAPRPSWRELDTNAMLNGIVIADQREAAQHESGDVLLSGASIYAELGEILSGEIAKPPSETTIIFKSMGLAVEDAVAAKLVFEAARKKGMNSNRPPKYDRTSPQ